jgi:hypothetical protein
VGNQDRLNLNQQHRPKDAPREFRGASGFIVHWTEYERDQIVPELEQYWNFGFVNVVQDLAD